MMFFEEESVFVDGNEATINDSIEVCQTQALYSVKEALAFLDSPDQHGPLDLHACAQTCLQRLRVLNIAVASVTVEADPQVLPGVQLVLDGPDPSGHNFRYDWTTAIAMAAQSVNVDRLSAPAVLAPQPTPRRGMRLTP